MRSSLGYRGSSRAEWLAFFAQNRAALLDRYSSIPGTVVCRLLDPSLRPDLAWLLPHLTEAAQRALARTMEDWHGKEVNTLPSILYGVTRSAVRPIVRCYEKESPATEVPFADLRGVGGLVQPDEAEPFYRLSAAEVMVQCFTALPQARRLLFFWIFCERRKLRLIARTMQISKTRVSQLAAQMLRTIGGSLTETKLPKSFFTKQPKNHIRFVSRHWDLVPDEEKERIIAEFALTAPK